MNTSFVLRAGSAPRLCSSCFAVALVAALCLGGATSAQADYVVASPPYVLAPVGLPTVLGNFNVGGTPTGNPNTITAATPLTPNTSVSIHTYSDPNPIYQEVEYELIWTLTNPFSAPMYTVTFWLQTFGNLLQYDGGIAGSTLDSTPWATQGTLVQGSWTASGMTFNMGAGLAGGQSATFHLPLDVLGPANGGNAFSNVMADSSFAPVPEPGSWLMCALGLTALAGWKRRTPQR
jgi:hypothetical protein